MVLMLYGTAAMLPPPVEESRRIVYAVIASVAMFELLISCLLIYGVFGRKPSLILPWLISCYVLVLSLVSLSVLGTVLIVLQFIQSQESIKEVSTMVAFYFAKAITIICLISVASGGDISGDVKHEEQNTTTLYPIEGLPNYLKRGEKNIHNNSETQEVPETRATSSLNNCVDDMEVMEPKKINNDKTVTKLNDSKDDGYDEVISNKEENKHATNKERTAWKINATYAPSSKDDESYQTKEILKDFKPSPHLGSFYDGDSLFSPPQINKESFKPYSPPQFTSFEKDFYKLNYKPPLDSYQRPVDNPYPFEDVVPRTEHIKFDTGLEVRPTVQAPVNIPAGGLYKLPETFQGKPNSDSGRQDYGLQFKEQKETSVKNRANPWKGLLHLVTSLLPVGLIVSALTPQVITLESTASGPRFRGRVSRRTEDVSSLPHISDGCKRRLLCEIHSEQEYMSYERRPCYKIRCEDPRSMSRLLNWLLDHHRPGYQPGDHDRRGYIIT
ncbi:unnamed protein product [Danaus chrysippus]|uniref:(African queen) hypothetical protein n=1 Tax=Danaus chrysippus TaxID=151541 RepID=A0A8J2WAL7_9NEOP|nr:unnamed protein product [Danaus chrysippus]